jgi:hypothetical protein
MATLHLFYPIRQNVGKFFSIFQLKRVAMTKKLQEWEHEFEDLLKDVPIEKRDKAGVLLPIIPSHDNWDNFCDSIRQAWHGWRHCLQAYPHCLVVVFGGLAFFAYDEHTFWPHFERAVGSGRLPVNQHTDVGKSFFSAADRLGLRTLMRNGERSFVGTAVFHTGIPLSLWEGFLAVCEWASWNSGWQNLVDEQWAEIVGKRVGGRQFLKNFLVGNRHAASEVISDFLAARELLRDVYNPTRQDIFSVWSARTEYLEEVPETLDFLVGEENAQSILDERVRLCWDESSRRIGVHLPPVAVENTFWVHGVTRRLAASSADVLWLNRAMFTDRLSVALEFADGRTETQSVQGLKPFGLFDARKENGRFVNTKRTFLPLGRYCLISLEKVSLDGSSGWEWDDEKMNQPYALEDGTECFVSYLCPDASRAKLVVDGGSKIEFGRKQQINLRVYAGRDDTHVFRFALKNTSELVMEQLPSLVLEIPDGFVEDSESVRSQEFQVFLNEKRAEGRWRFFEDYEKHGEKWEYFFWEWKSLAENGRHEITVRSQRSGILPFGLRRSQTVEIVKPTPEVWPNLVGRDKYFAWVFLSAVQDEPTWEEFWIARNSIAGLKNVSLNQNDWENLEENGYIRRKWGTTEVLKTCLAFRQNVGNSFVAHFCGLVSRLYPLVREVTPLRACLKNRIWAVGQPMSQRD